MAIIYCVAEQWKIFKYHSNALINNCDIIILGERKKEKLALNGEELHYLHHCESRHTGSKIDQQIKKYLHKHNLYIMSAVDTREPKPYFGTRFL